MQVIAVVDYGMGNVQSVVNALRVVAPLQQVQVSAAPEVLLAADRIVFPGQGAMPDCLAALQNNGLWQVLPELLQKKPFLGICLGLQVLMNESEEAPGAKALRFFSGSVAYFSQAKDQGLKVPQIGWNQLWQAQAHPLWSGIPDQSWFYFVHSYFVVPESTDFTVGVSDYGGLFTAALAKDNVFALQCHPEKSAAAGLKLLENFSKWL
jgi:glutamine amidotransferase